MLVREIITVTVTTKVNVEVWNDKPGGKYSTWCNLKGFNAPKIPVV